MSLFLSPTIALAIAPLIPQAGDIKSALAEDGFSVSLRSRNEPIEPTTEIYIADTLGELGVFYRLCDIVLVGGSLVAKGGHNPLEPARLDAAILHGPHTYNFADTYAEMRTAGGAALVRNEADLAASAARLFDDDKTRAAMAAAAMAAAEASAHKVLHDIVDVLEPLLPPSRS